MSNIYRVSVVGDKRVKNVFKFEKKILKIVANIIEEHEQVEFYFDNYSEIWNYSVFVGYNNSFRYAMETV